MTSVLTTVPLTDPFKSPVTGPMVVLASIAPRFVISIPPTGWQCWCLLFFCAAAPATRNVTAARIETALLILLNRMFVLLSGIAPQVPVYATLWVGGQCGESEFWLSLL